MQFCRICSCVSVLRDWWQRLKFVTLESSLYHFESVRHSGPCVIVDGAGDALYTSTAGHSSAMIAHGQHWAVTPDACLSVSVLRLPRYVRSGCAYRISPFAAITRRISCVFLLIWVWMNELMPRIVSLGTFLCVRKDQQLS